MIVELGESQPWFLYKVVDPNIKSDPKIESILKTYLALSILCLAC